VSAAGSNRGAGAAADLSEQLRNLLPHFFKPPSQLLRSSDAAEEVVVAHCGAVEIHQTLPGWYLETRVKGEPERARATALRRLANFVGGMNRDSIRLRVVRPLVQVEEARGRWRVGIRLADDDGEIASASARNGKVMMRASVSETLAVLRVPGRPTPLAMQHAETAIRLALGPTRWEATGAAMLRLHSLPAILPFLGRFEVAVPVAERPLDSAASSWTRTVPLREAATASSPSVH
jgi:hypothetical protein